MIRLLGAMEGSEGEAARTLRQLILESWPWAGSDPETEVYIIAGVKCNGQPVTDLDLVVLGQFSAQASYVPFLSFFDAWSNAPKKPDAIHVKSFCLVIEVKDSGTENVQFDGTQVKVRYGRGWKNVTEQSHKQVYALKNDLQHHGIAAPYI